MIYEYTILPDGRSNLSAICGYCSAICGYCSAKKADQWVRAPRRHCICDNEFISKIYYVKFDFFYSKQNIPHFTTHTAVATPGHVSKSNMSGNPATDAQDPNAQTTETQATETQATEKVSKSKKRNQRKKLKAAEAAAALAAELAAKEAKLVTAAAAAAAANKRESARADLTRLKCCVIANYNATENNNVEYSVVLPDLSKIMQPNVADIILALCTHSNQFQCLYTVIGGRSVPNLVRSNNPVNVSSKQHGVNGRPHYDGVQFNLHTVRTAGFVPVGANGKINTSIGDVVVTFHPVTELENGNLHVNYLDNPPSIHSGEYFNTANFFVQHKLSMNKVVGFIVNVRTSSSEPFTAEFIPTPGSVLLCKVKPSAPKPPIVPYVPIPVDDVLRGILERGKAANEAAAKAAAKATPSFM